MASTHLVIHNSVVEKLTKFRDENDFVSYTDAIAELLRRNESLTYRVVLPPREGKGKERNIIIKLKV